MQFHTAHCYFPEGILTIPYYPHKISTTAANLKHAMLHFQQNFRNVNSKVGNFGCKSNTTSSFENVTLRPELLPAHGKMSSCDITHTYTCNQPIIIFDHLILCPPVSNPLFTEAFYCIRFTELLCFLQFKLNFTVRETSLYI